MHLDTIQQNARSIADALKIYSQYENRNDGQSRNKKEKIRLYILKLCYNIQKSIDEEQAIL